MSLGIILAGTALRLAKSSLFGVIPLGDELGSRRHQTLAVLLSLLLLAMVTVCTALWPSEYGRPTSFTRTFGTPALVPFCLGYATIVERLGRFSKVLHHTGVAMGLLLVASSVAFFARTP